MDIPPAQLASRETLVDIVRRRADRHPERPAFLFLPDGETVGERLTYGELDRRARAIASMLQGRLTGGDRALLIYPPGLDFVCAFYACLYAGVVAVPAYPPEPSRLHQTLLRLRAIAVDSEPSIVLATARVLAAAELLATELASELTCPRLATDECGPESCGDWREPALRGDRPAFCQYTSGSTASPKGVVVTHKNLVENSATIHREFGHDERMVTISWLPTYHDMGLIGHVVQTVYSGGLSVLFPTFVFLQKPRVWLQGIGRYGVTSSGGPNFAYDLCVRRIPAGARAGIDLSSWQVAYNGSEPVRAETMERFANAFEPCGFRRQSFFPCYGLAEATLFVSGGPRGRAPRAISAGDDRQLVSSGRVPAEHRVAVVDPATSERCPDGRIGEIWLKGPSVAAGYWNRTGDSRSAFRARISRTLEGPFLRTGDMGFLRDGELFVTGRIKDLFIVGGRNVHPEDVEWTVATRVPGIRPGGCAAFAVESDGREQVVIVAEVTGEPSPSERDALARLVRAAVSVEHDLHIHRVSLVAPRTLPKTSSGKLQRHACRAAFLGSTLELGADRADPARESRQDRP